MFQLTYTMRHEPIKIKRDYWMRLNKILRIVRSKRVFGLGENTLRDNYSCYTQAESKNYRQRVGQKLCKFFATKVCVYIRKDFNSHRTGLGPHQQDRGDVV